MYDPIDSDFNNSWYTFFGTSSYTHAFPLLKTTSKVFDLGSYPIAYIMLELTFFKFTYSLQMNHVISFSLFLSEVPQEIKGFRKEIHTVEHLKSPVAVNHSLERFIRLSHPLLLTNEEHPLPRE